MSIGGRICAQVASACRIITRDMIIGLTVDFKLSELMQLVWVVLTGTAMQAVAQTTLVPKHCQHGALPAFTFQLAASTHEMKETAP